MNTHARVAPSSLHLTVPCPGSLQLQEQVPPAPETEEQAEGTAAHLVAMWTAKRRQMHVGEEFESGGKKWVVDDDMLDGAILYAAETSIAGRFEDPVEAADIHEECYGTPDFWMLLTSSIFGEDVLKVVDYKYGHRYIEVYEHWQLIAYAIGAWRRIGSPPGLKIRLVIVQPRAYHRDGPVRTWDTTAEDLLIYAAYMRERVLLALAPNPPTHTGRHCLDCRARHVCATLRYTTDSIVDFSATAEAQHLSNEAVGQELRILKEATKRLEARYTGLYEQASNLARSGIPIAFWSMQQGRSNLRWMSDTTPEQIASMGELLGINVQKPVALITPTQAISAGLEESIVLQYAERPKGALTLKPDDTVALRKAFGVKKT